MIHEAKGSRSRTSVNVGRLIAFGMATGVGLAGCCGLGGGGGSKHHCWAAVDWQEARQAAAGSNANADKAKSGAQEGMCMGYCEFADTNVNEELAKYYQTAKGAGSRAGRGFDIDHHPPAKKQYDRCVAACAAAVKSGKAKSKFECRAPTSKACTAQLEYEGKKHTGKAKGGQGEMEAWRLACRAYCKKDDPDVAKAYDEWAKSPQGKKSKAPRAKALESERPSDQVNGCMGRCVADILFGKASVSVTCK